MKKYGTLVMIGRFEPVTNAHATIIRRAMQLAEKLIIIVGSTEQPRTYKNPFTFAERKMMLFSVVDEYEGDVSPVNVIVKPSFDTIYNDSAWASQIQKIVLIHKRCEGTVGIIGHKKSGSELDFNMFPQWAFEDTGLVEPLNASNVRDLYFKRDANMGFIEGVVPKSTLNFLREFKLSHAYQNIIEEREFVAKYKQQYASLPYPPIFVTVDACVVQSGHVLLIKRRAVPGKGLWALPGGYVNANTDKNLEDAMIRELREETGIKVPEPVLRGSITKARVFDAVDRSPRGRIITHCYKIELPPGELPKVKGMDDAEKAKWIPISEVTSDKCFEDHWEMIQIMVGNL